MTPSAGTPGRRLALAAAGLAALGAGAWWGWRARNDAEAALWNQPFDTLEGAPLRLGEVADGRWLLLNFWASWCPPCVEEMPLLDRFQREYVTNGWQVVGVAVDNAPPIRAFLARQPVGFPVAIAGLDGLHWARELGNAAGGLPFSVVFDPRRIPRAHHAGGLKWPQLESWARLPHPTR